MKKVLLASASRVFLERNIDLLQMRGVRLFTVTRGSEALKLHEKHRYDLIISDMLLEEMDGCTLCSHLLKIENIPVILICHDKPGIREKVERSGAIAALLKPVSPIQILETVRRFIGLLDRKSKRAALKVKVFSKTGDKEFFCLSHDISNTGMLLATEYRLELGERINCQFTLPGSHQVEIEGEVIRSTGAPGSETLYGVQFIATPASTQSAIGSYVASSSETASYSEITSSMASQMTLLQ